MTKVTIAGTAGTVEVTPGDDATVLDVLEEAAATLGITVDADRLALVVNGQDADRETRVAPGDRITAAPRVRNG